MLKGAAWQRLLTDVYVSATQFDADDHRMWCEANALVMPSEAVLGGWSAAFLHGIDVLPSNPDVWMSAPITTRVRSRNRLLVQRTPLTDTDRCRIGHFAVTTALRSAFDLGRRLPRTEAVCAIDAMCHQLVDIQQLSAMAADRIGWPGSRQLRQVLSLAEPLSESPMETRARLVLVDADAPTLTAQFEVRDVNGTLLGRLDLAYPELMIGIEYDGDHHRERGQFRQDIARVNRLQEAGWLILRFTADDVLRHPDRLIRQVAAAVRSRR
jgi:hypothetical protein